MATETETEKLGTKGSKTFLVGEPGSGKTTSLVSFIESGLKHDLPLKLAVLITDPDGEDSLLKAMDERKLPLDRLYYHYVPPAARDWKALIATAKRVNTMGYKDLTEIKSGIEKNQYTQFLDVLECLSDFVDQHGESHGPVDSWDSNMMLAVDSVSGINVMALKLMTGGKPAPHQGEWGVSMNLEEDLITKLVSTTKCFVTLTGHVDKEVDEVIGKPQFMPALLGRKLAPKLPRIFSDVILQIRDIDKFMWSTVRRDYSCLKARNVGHKDNLQPTFEPMVSAWMKRQKLVESAE